MNKILKLSIILFSILSTQSVHAFLSLNYMYIHSSDVSALGPSLVSLDTGASASLENPAFSAFGNGINSEIYSISRITATGTMWNIRGIGVRYTSRIFGISLIGTEINMYSSSKNIALGAAIRFPFDIYLGTNLNYMRFQTGFFPDESTSGLTQDLGIFYQNNFHTGFLKQQLSGGFAINNAHQYFLDEFSTPEHKRMLYKTGIAWTLVPDNLFFKTINEISVITENYIMTDFYPEFAENNGYEWLLHENIITLGMSIELWKIISLKAGYSRIFEGVQKEEILRNHFFDEGSAGRFQYGASLDLPVKREQYINNPIELKISISNSPEFDLYYINMEDDTLSGGYSIEVELNVGI